MDGPRGPAIPSTAGPAADPQGWLPKRWLASPAQPGAHRPSGQGGRSKRLANRRTIVLHPLRDQQQSRHLHPDAGRGTPQQAPTQQLQVKPRQLGRVSAIQGHPHETHIAGTRGLTHRATIAASNLLGLTGGRSLMALGVLAVLACRDVVLVDSSHGRVTAGTGPAHRSRRTRTR
jgi:hypothetical protein